MLYTEDANASVRCVWFSFWTVTAVCTREHHEPRGKRNEMTLSTEKIIKTQKVIDQMAHQFFYYIRPVIFGELPLKSLNPKLKNATITFIETKNKIFGITNQHVIDVYRKELRNGGDINFQISNLKIDILNRIIDENEKLDLATINIEESEKDFLKLSPLYHKSWPVPIPKKDEFVFIIGYLGEFRSVNSLDRINMPHGSLVMQVASVSEKKFGIKFDRDKWIKKYKTHDPSELKDWGGFSGGGVFRINGIYPELVGLNFEFQPNFDILYCLHSRLIDENGEIIEIY